eukprot:851391-Pelagomonas_calceolata.AAC.1
MMQDAWTPPLPYLPCKADSLITERDREKLCRQRNFSEQKGLVGIWRVAGRTRLQHLAVKRILFPIARLVPSRGSIVIQLQMPPFLIRRITSSTPCVISVMRVDRSVLKGASGASKLVSVRDRMSMKLQSKLAYWTE